MRSGRFHESPSSDLHPRRVYVGTAASLRAVTPCGLQQNGLATIAVVVVAAEAAVAVVGHPPMIKSH
jgi:hypothetical protein